MGFPIFELYRKLLKNFIDLILAGLRLFDKYPVREMVNYFVDGINGMIYTGKVRVDV